MQLIKSAKPFALARFLFLIFSVAPRPAPAIGQPHTPYSYFQSLPNNQLDSLRVKLTYGGPQNMIFQTLIFALPGTPTPTSTFTTFHRAGFDYTNDEGPVVSFTASTQELRAILYRIGSLPRVTDGGVDPNGDVSFALLHSSRSGVRVFEAIINDTTGRQLFDGLQSALINNSLGVSLLRDFGCALLVPSDTPTNVGGITNVTIDELQRDRTDRSVYRGRVVLRNISGTTIKPPVYLVVMPRGNASLRAPDGYTCHVADQGTAFVIISRRTIAPGGAIHKLLRFSNVGDDKFETSFRVFAGAGTP